MFFVRGKKNVDHSNIVTSSAMFLNRCFNRVAARRELTPLTVASMCLSRRSLSSRAAVGDVVVSFKDTTYEYVHDKPIIKDANFSIRKGSKVTIMGQNGSGKSTILKLVNGDIKPSSGFINIGVGLSVAVAKQASIYCDSFHIWSI